MKEKKVQKKYKAGRKKPIIKTNLLSNVKMNQK